MARYITAVIDLQYGSTGKGQIAGTIAQHWEPDTVVTAWGPNAGHTFRDGELQMVSRMVASSAIVDSVEYILLGPGSVIDLDCLRQELEDRGHRHLNGKCLIIHPQAAILRPSDAEIEREILLRIGSTMKGTAEAAIRKIRREPDAVAMGCVHLVHEKLGQTAVECGLSVSISSSHYDKALDRSHKLMVEGAQGFSLGLHTDFYPHATGRDVSTAQLFADCRIPFNSFGAWPRVHVIGVCRTYPIRVANRFAASGRQVGSSGGYYPDQREITWESIGQQAELTTVTKLPRRIFTFSAEQIRQAVRICAPTHIALTFCDYVNALPPEQLPHNGIDAWVEVVKQASLGVPVRFMSFGPDTSDIMRKMFPDTLLRPLLSTRCDYLGDI